MEGSLQPGSQEGPDAIRVTPNTRKLASMKADLMQIDEDEDKVCPSLLNIQNSHTFFSP